MLARGRRRVPDPRPLTPDPMPSGREVIERVTTATGEWQLQRAGSHFEIICNGVFLMASYNQDSDRALAALAVRRVVGGGRRGLLGGLGIGSTAQAALEDPRVGRLEVVEIEPVVLAWHRVHFAALSGRPLEDPRARLLLSDVHDVPLTPASYDAILLDTDNGPDWLARDLNERLYTAAGLARCLEALTSRGGLALWSADASSRLVDTLRGSGAAIESIAVTDAIAPGRPGTAWIYLARNQRKRENGEPRKRS